METVNSLTARPRYTDKISLFIGNGNVKIITGIRRCGKSSVLKLLVGSFTGCNLIYLNMELAKNYELRDWQALLARVRAAAVPNGTNILCLDEVQNIIGWELAVRDLLARGGYDIYLIGSNANLLSSEYATHLGGRFNEVRMLPLSYGECCDFQRRFGGPADVFGSFLRIGGFPILWRSPTDIQASMQTVRDLVDVAVVNDIEERYGIKSRPLLRDLLRCVLSTVGKYVSANTLYNTMRSAGIKVSADTVYSYLGYLEAANLLIRAETFDLRDKRVLTAKYKYYVTDLGIKHALLGYRPEDTPGHLENIVFTELLGRGYEVYVGEVSGLEIDFVAEKNGSRLYVQVCQAVHSEETMTRELRSLNAVGDSFPKYLVLLEPGVYEGVTAQGIICCGLADFLTRKL